jgi:8-oxo-dGTP pyrophosphatase MutT (NUDIX family)
MMYTSLLKTGLKLALNKELPGIHSHLKLAPKKRIKGIGKNESSNNAKASAVLIVLFREHKQTKIVFILRSVYEGVHSGQISFPGGQKEDTDKDMVDTALRETKEEIGIEIGRENIIGKLSNLYIPNSNFCVEPYIAFIDKLDKLIPDDIEVQHIYII